MFHFVDKEYVIWLSKLALTSVALTSVALTSMALASVALISVALTSVALASAAMTWSLTRSVTRYLTIPGLINIALRSAL